MNNFQAFVLGLIQGLTEFLPVSSSAHLFLSRWLFGWEDAGLSFDVAMHLGTLLAVVFTYRDDLIQWLKFGWKWPMGINTPQTQFPWKIAFATIPAALAGVFLNDLAETTFRSPILMASTLAGVAILLFIAEKKFTGTKPVEEAPWIYFFLIGLAQCLALVPGVSRSGITISAALFLGMTKPGAVRLSFLLSIPIIAGATILKSNYILQEIQNATIWWGLIGAIISGWIAIRLLIKIASKWTFTPFVIYRIILAGIVIFVWTAR